MDETAGSMPMISLLLVLVMPGWHLARLLATILSWPKLWTFQNSRPDMVRSPDMFPHTSQQFMISLRTSTTPDVPIPATELGKCQPWFSQIVSCHTQEKHFKKQSLYQSLSVVSFNKWWSWNFSYNWSKHETKDMDIIWNYLINKLHKSKCHYKLSRSCWCKLEFRTSCFISPPPPSPFKKKLTRNCGLNSKSKDRRYKYDTYEKSWT